MICIVCPLGCKLTITQGAVNKEGYEISGNKCSRGLDYAVEEMTNPTRVLTTTVKINNAHLDRLPIRTKGSIPKSHIFKIMKVINKVEVTAPVTMGQVIIKNILGTGVDVIASRSMPYLK